MNQDSYARAVWMIEALDKRYKNAKAVGWVYIMRSPAFKKSLLKIGKTARPPHQRAHELGRSTSVPEEFELVYFVHTLDRHAAEKAVHRELDEYRTRSSKEFFDLPLAAAIEALDRAASKYPIPYGHDGMQYLPQAFDERLFTCSACGAKNRFKELAIPVRPKCRTCGSGLAGAQPG